MSDPRTWLPFDYMDEVIPPPTGKPGRAADQARA